jgi:hypothetical protein
MHLPTLPTTADRVSVIWLQSWLGFLPMNIVMTGVSGQLPLLLLGVWEHVS